MSFIAKSLEKKQGIRRYIGPKRILGLILLVALVVWAWNYYHSGNLNIALVEKYRADHPLVSIALFILIYAVSVISLLPTLPLNLAAGYFWGGILGGVLATLGATIGACFAFASTRWLVGQPLARHFGSELARKVEDEFDRSGWKFVAFARISPVIPTGPLNYLLGLTSISALTFLWSTFLFLLPPAIAFAYVGDVLQAVSLEKVGATEMVREIFIVSAIITVLILIKYFLKIKREKR